MPPPPMIPMLLSPSPSETESEPDTDDPTLLLAAGTQSRLRRRPAVAVHARLLPDSSAPGTAIFCGVEQYADPAIDTWWDTQHPAVVPFLPSPLDNEQSTPQQLRTKVPHRSTGCGGRLHASAHAARGGGRWVGYVEGVERTVVPLESQYFAPRDRSTLGLGAAGCGCVVEGVGCAVCGNALGALHTTCRAHQSRKGQTHYVFLPGAVSPPIKDAESSQPSDPALAPVHAPPLTDENMPPTRGLEQSTPGFEQRSYDGPPLTEWTHYLRPRTPPTRSTARTPEVARIEAQLAAAFGRSMAEAEADAASTSADAEALAVSRRAVEARDRILPPPPLPITTSAAPESATEDRETPDQMEVDNDTALPALLPLESDAAAPPAPPPGPTAPLAPAPPAAPTATAVYQNDIVHTGAEIELPFEISDIITMQLEPMVFTTPPTMRVPLPGPENPSTGAGPVSVSTMAADERARARITALFAHRWERSTIDHHHSQASTSASPSASPLPPLVRAASTSAAPAGTPRSLRRTSARPDLHAAATSRAQLVGRRRTPTPTSMATTSTPTGTGTSTPPAPAVRFPSVREQEAWLAAEAGGRRPLRRASVPDLRRRAGTGAGVSAGDEDYGTRIVRRLVRLREPLGEGAGTTTAMEVDGDAADSDGETVRAGGGAQALTPSPPPLSSAHAPVSVDPPPHIVRIRERMLARERHRMEMMRFLGGQRMNVIEYTDVSRPQAQAQAPSAAREGPATVVEAPRPPPLVRARTWFER
ncbi:hypothetical protein B0H19DRAFT_1176178 [Mycena capillaripes]|nr:hypothetical protein B0H19DRAFT_1176178 [Mycena capillaripes]